MKNKLFMFIFFMFTWFNVLSQTATYYCCYFHGRTTYSGEKFDENEFTAAHKTLPMNTWVKVINLENNHYVYVRINDRLPKLSKATLDLSKKAFSELAPLEQGRIKIQIEIINLNPF